VAMGVKGCVVEAVVDFVGEDEDVMLHAEVADSEELGVGEDFADGVVRGVYDDHARLRCYGGFEFGHI